MRTVSSFTTSDNISYNIAGTNTISNGTAAVVSVWLPSNSSFETTMLEINGQKYIDLYQRSMSTVTTTLKKAHQLTVGASPNGTTAILNPLTIFNSYIAEGDSITISATPNSGYDFKGWSANGITLADKTGNPLTISMATNYVTLTPVFVISATGITLDKTTLSLLTNLSESITATVQPTNAADKSVTWSSSDINIATVDAAGVVTGKNVGTATIAVATTDGGYSASCTVTITAAYTVTPSTLTFTGGTSDLTFKVNEPAMTELQSVTVDGVTFGDEQLYSDLRKHGDHFEKQLAHCTTQWNVCDYYQLCQRQSWSDTHCRSEQYIQRK